MKKAKVFGIFIILFLSFIFHFAYNFYPNSISSILFPVNESIWEHMKLIVTPVMLFSLFEYLYYKKKNIKVYNFLFSNIVASLLGIIIYLVLYLPLEYLFGHSLILAIILLTIVFIIIEVITYYLELKSIKNSKLIGIILLILTYIIFAYLTYNPPKTNLFYDKIKNNYGIIKDSN